MKQFAIGWRSNNWQTTFLAVFALASFAATALSLVLPSLESFFFTLSIIGSILFTLSREGSRGRLGARIGIVSGQFALLKNNFLKAQAEVEYEEVYDLDKLEIQHQRVSEILSNANDLKKDSPKRLSEMVKTRSNCIRIAKKYRDKGLHEEARRFDSWAKEEAKFVRRLKESDKKVDKIIEECQAIKLQIENEAVVAEAIEILKRQIDQVANQVDGAVKTEADFAEEHSKIVKELELCS